MTWIILLLKTSVGCYDLANGLQGGVEQRLVGAPVYVSGVGSPGHDCSNGFREKWMDSKHILKVEYTIRSLN